MALGIYTKVRDLPFRFPFMVLEERLAVPIWQGGEGEGDHFDFDLGQLAHLANVGIEELCKTIEGILVLTDNLEVDASTLYEAMMGPKTKPVLVDVRTQAEFDIAHIEGSILLEKANFEYLLNEWLSSPDQEIITICHHGIRSYSAALFLRDKGLKSVWSLCGGLDLWAQQIDTDMPRY